jgi:transcriptional regulator
MPTPSPAAVPGGDIVYSADDCTRRAGNLSCASFVSLLVNLQERPMSDQTDLIQGTLDLLILRTIALEPMHGWAIAQRIQQLSNELLKVQQGSLYPALHRLEHQGWITAEWGASDNNRRARFYSLTRAGRKQLATEVSKWERLSSGVNLVLEHS